MKNDPTLSEILEYVDSLGFDIAKDADDYDAEIQQFDLYKVIYYIACHHHSGQWSNLYQVIDQTEYRPSPFERSLPNFEDEPIQSDLYTRLSHWLRD